ncbi:MAG: hypothetical protein QTN59_05435 [Candidatus Electrothrix communis]|nr:MAG: hypothetical protein QTN59_05435 [Candidatus Electrothrix communis]
MSHPLVFNHHSLPLNSAEDIHPAITEFLKLCLSTQRIGFTVILVDETVDGDWFRLKLVRGCFWQDWYQQHSNDPKYRESISTFRSIKTSQPFFTSEDSAKDVELFDAYLPNTRKNLSALKAAAWHESPLLSFSTRPPWTSSPIVVFLAKMSDDGEIVNSTDQLCNLYSVEQFKKEKPELQEKVQRRIRSGRELLEQSQALYPRLCFCGKSQEQLRAWPYPISLLEQVKDALNILNNFAEDWREGRVSQYTHDTLRELGLQNEVSGESKSIKQDPKLKKIREFYLPTGEKAFFENHVKFGRAIRMHFFVQPENHTFFIGYIGSHLPL